VSVCLPFLRQEVDTRTSKRVVMSSLIHVTNTQIPGSRSDGGDHLHERIGHTHKPLGLQVGVDSQGAGERGGEDAICVAL
jgi:hypothetical protein